MLLTRQYLEAFAEFARHCKVKEAQAIAIKGATMAVNDNRVESLRDWASYLLESAQDWKGDQARECKDAICTLINKGA